MIFKLWTNFFNINGFCIFHKYNGMWISHRYTNHFICFTIYGNIFPNLRMSKNTICICSKL